MLCSDGNRSANVSEVAKNLFNNLHEVLHTLHDEPTPLLAAIQYNRQDFISILIAHWSDLLCYPSEKVPIIYAYGFVPNDATEQDFEIIPEGFLLY